MKAEIISAVALAALLLMLGNPHPVAGTYVLRDLELWLAFSLVFTFVAGMEVLK